MNTRGAQGVQGAQGVAGQDGADGQDGTDATVTDDSVLDLAKATRTTADRGKALGTSSTDQDALALLSMPAVPAKASNADVDGETDDADYTTVAKVFRADSPQG